MRIGSVLLLTMAVPACNGARAISDQGFACLLPPDTTLLTSVVDLPTEASLSVIVNFGDCFAWNAGSADAECSVTRDGNELLITASATVSTPFSVGCHPAACGEIETDCAMDPLPPGTYTLHYAGETHQLTLPYSGAPPCLGAAP